MVPLKIGPPDRPMQNKWSPRTAYRSHTRSPPATDGPTLLMAFRASVEAEK